MGLAMAGRQLSRNDRHVRRARLRVDTGVSKQRLIFNIEEALRLCSLPGENEGRIYYFRCLHLSGLTDDADRWTWLRAVQCEMLVLAGRAMHGSDAAAPDADAVFFRSEQEACETLLALSLHHRIPAAWFWPAVSGVPAGAGAATCAVALIERLRRLPAKWVAVAAAVFSVVETVDARALLNLLPDADVRGWLRELEDDRPTPLALPTRIPASTRAIVVRAANALGPDDARVLWLASLAVGLAHPADLEHGTAVSRARLLLRTPDPFDAGLRQRPTRDSPEGLASDETENLPTPSLDLAPSRGARERAPHIQERSDARPPACGAIADDGAPGLDATAVSAEPRHGEATSGAGLYFILNAVRYLRPDDDPFDPWFLAPFLQRVAHHAGIEGSDPILRWTRITLDQYDHAEIDERLLRTWILQVRRWCWRTGSISVREIVRRPGRVTLTRTDLDVSLALELADVRIRRLGLDLDPGWLPWFGRVVRFHYLDRGELHA
jgi:hypothetical protein